MKAWQLQNGRVRLLSVEPHDPGPGDVLVDVYYAGICGSDVPKLLRPHDFELPTSWRPGHEIVGTDADERWVVVDPLIGCDGCDRCSRGEVHLCPGLK
jgi:L-iditol 2-dehydrogenase